MQSTVEKEHPTIVFPLFSELPVAIKLVLTDAGHEGKRRVRGLPAGRGKARGEAGFFDAGSRESTVL